MKENKIQLREEKAKKRKKKEIPFSKPKGGEEGMEKLFEEFKDMFLKDVPHGFPPLRGIKNHKDLTFGESFPKSCCI
ncbi:hypothetical protein CR513_24222, partial [Mucuna pruriens]